VKDSEAPYFVGAPLDGSRMERLPGSGIAAAGAAHYRGRLWSPLPRAEVIPQVVAFPSVTPGQARFRDPRYIALAAIVEGSLTPTLASVEGVSSVARTFCSDMQHGSVHGATPTEARRD